MSNKSDKLVIRLISIIVRLNQGEELTVKELADEFNVSRRTIQTDLNQRLNQFLPIVKNREKYSLESYMIGQLEFKDMEKFAFISGVANLYPSMDKTFLADLLNDKISEACLVKGAHYEDISNKKEQFDLIRLATTLNHKLQFVYNEKERLADPYKLLNNHNNIWYLVAVEDQILKTFTFSKLSALKVTELEFVPDPDILSTIKTTNQNWYSQEPFSVILEIDTSVKEYFLRRELLPNQTILKETDHSFVVKTVASYDEEILRVVRYWIPHIRIIEPEMLQEQLLKQLNSYIGY